MNEKRLILVIEDEHAISNFICRALAANDYKAIPASSGKEGLSLFFSHSPDLVLLDAGEGGTGETFDWSLLAGIHRPYFLAGGCTRGT